MTFTPHDILEIPEDVANHSSGQRSPILDTHPDVRWWLEHLRKLEVSDQELKHVVLNHLYTWMYDKSFETFLKEARMTDVYNDKLKISQRREIRDCILQGNMDDAVELIDKLDPLILRENYEILFQIRLSQLYALIKSGKVLEAAQFARQQMPKCHQNDAKLFEKLENTMSLVTFTDLTVPEAVDIISEIDTRDEISQRIDVLIMRHFKLQSLSILDCLVKETLFVEAKAESLGVLPKIKLSNIERSGFSYRQ